MTSAELSIAVSDAYNAGVEVTDEVARAIAAAWHGGQMSAFYSFSSAGHFDRTALLDELSENIGQSYGDADAADRLALNMFGTYLLNR